MVAVEGDNQLWGWGLIVGSGGVIVGCGGGVTEALACHLDYKRTGADRRHISINTIAQRERLVGQ